MDEAEVVDEDGYATPGETAFYWKNRASRAFIASKDKFMPGFK